VDALVSTPQAGTASASALGKGLKLMSAVAERRERGATLSALARRHDLAPATAHRILRELVDEGFLSFDPYAKTYRVGPALWRIAGL